MYKCTLDYPNSRIKMYPIHYIFTREETWDWARRTQRGAWKAKHWDTIKIEMYRIHRPYKIKMYRASFEICIDFFHQLTTYLAVLRAGYISAVKNIIKFSIEMVFRHHNCSYLLWEKLLKFEDEGREFAKIFEITRTIYLNSERSEQFLVTECFFNLFLEVSHI